MLLLVTCILISFSFHSIASISYLGYEDVKRN